MGAGMPGADWVGNVRAALPVSPPGQPVPASGEMKSSKPRQAPPPKQPTPDLLRSAALAHLARYAATEAGLIRVLDRRIQRWARTASEDERDNAAGLKAAARQIVESLASAGAVSDSAFAAARTRSLQRAGKSTRAIGAHLTARGVATSLAQAVRPTSPEAELAAAALHLRRRHHGGFRASAGTPEQDRRELAALARAGFGREVAQRAMRLTREEAEEIITAFRADL
jgi:regulatory protein